MNWAGHPSGLVNRSRTSTCIHKAKVTSSTHRVTNTQVSSLAWCQNLQHQDVLALASRVTTGMRAAISSLSQTDRLHTCYYCLQGVNRCETTYKLFALRVSLLKNRDRKRLAYFALSDQSPFVYPRTDRRWQLRCELAQAN